MMSTYKYDAGVDLKIKETTIIEPGETLVLDTGVKYNVPKRYMGMLLPRSSNRGLYVSNAPIDSGYTGTIKVIVTNISNESRMLMEEESFCQLVIVKIKNWQYFLRKGKRGNKWNGSSNVSKCQNVTK